METSQTVFLGARPWGVKDGPSIGTKLVEITSTDRLKFDYSCESQYLGESDDPNACPHWPAYLKVTPAGQAAGIITTHGKPYEEAEFIELVKSSQSNPEIELNTLGWKEREAALRCMVKKRLENAQKPYRANQ